MEDEKNRSNKITKGIITSLCTIFAVCFIFAINTISVSAKVTRNEEILPETYTLTLEERGGESEQINGADIGLKYESKTPNEVTYDEKLLKECLDKLYCLDLSKTIEPQNAKIEYIDNGYIIKNEIYGNSINRDILYECVVKAIVNRDKIINLESSNCYNNPKYYSNSESVIYAEDILNKYIASKINYNFAGLTQVLDGSIIKDWISVDDNFQVILDEAKVRNYVETLASTYNNSLGTNIKVCGGYDGNNHSWIIDSPEEMKALIGDIKNGQSITKNPIYAQKSSASYFRNVGETYVEIDMTKQHLWYYKDGYLVVDGDIVTGDVLSGCATPVGVYNLYYKQKDTILRGPGYASPVSFWMPFNRGIGLHDASWRDEFGGEIYKTDGSHGCINAPYYVAKAVYDNINSGDPIICYN